MIVNKSQECIISSYYFFLRSVLTAFEYMDSKYHIRLHIYIYPSSNLIWLLYMFVNKFNDIIKKKTLRALQCIQTHMVWLSLLMIMIMKSIMFMFYRTRYDRNETRMCVLAKDEEKEKRGEKKPSGLALHIHDNYYLLQL